MADLGIPLSKVGALLNPAVDPTPEVPFPTPEWPTDEQLVTWTNIIKAWKLAGSSLFSINKENNRFRGKYATRLAELLYM